jgi:hypothetical protein
LMSKFNGNDHAKDSDNDLGSDRAGCREDWGISGCGVC